MKKGSCCTICIPIRNTSNKDIVLKQGTVLGLFQAVEAVFTLATDTHNSKFQVDRCSIKGLSFRSKGLHSRMCSEWSRMWLGGAMVLGKLPVPGRPTIWMIVGQGPIALAIGAGGGCLDIFTLIYSCSPPSPFLRETARYRLTYCLKGPLNQNKNSAECGVSPACHFS